MIKNVRNGVYREKGKIATHESLREVANFIEFLEVQRTRLVEREEKKEKGDLFAKAIGICEGPSDLAERHDKHVYG